MPLFLKFALWKPLKALIVSNYGMKWGWVLILAAVLLAGCVQQYVCPDGTTLVNNPSQCPPAEEPEEEPQEQVVEEPVIEEPEINDTPEEPEVVEETMTLEKEVHDMITQAYKRVESYKFLYVGPPEGVPQDIYSVRGDMAKVLVMKATDHYISQPYTHIVLDMDEETARAICEATEANRCEEGFKDLGRVPYDEWKVKFPMEWLDEIEGAEYMGKGPRFEDRETEKIRFETQDASGVMHLIKFYYIPARVILDDGTEYEYRDLSMNTLSEKDVTANI